jgi:hypothetical protein
MLRYGLCLLAGLGCAAVAAAEETKVVITVERPTNETPDSKPPFHGKRPTVDVALLVDTSNSMDHRPAICQGEKSGADPPSAGRAV